MPPTLAIRGATCVERGCLGNAALGLPQNLGPRSPQSRSTGVGESMHQFAQMCGEPAHMAKGVCPETGFRVWETAETKSGHSVSAVIMPPRVPARRLEEAILNATKIPSASKFNFHIDFKSQF